MYEALALWAVVSPGVVLMAYCLGHIHEIESIESQARSSERWR